MSVLVEAVNSAVGAYENVIRVCIHHPPDQRVRPG